MYRTSRHNELLNDLKGRCRSTCLNRHLRNKDSRNKKREAGGRAISQIQDVVRALMKTVAVVTDSTFKMIKE